MKILKRAGTVVLSVILWAIILIAALYAFTTMATRDNQNVANLFGYTPLTVQSDSMVPTFASGDLIFIKKCDPATLQEGDIICFHTIIDNEYALNTHRIQSIETVGDARSYTTVGDNNNGIADQHVISDGDIVGKYVGHLVGFGKVMDFLSSSTGFLVVIILPMLLFFIYQIYHLITISIRLKRALAVENARAEEIARMEAAQKMMGQRPMPQQGMPGQPMPMAGGQGQPQMTAGAPMPQPGAPTANQPVAGMPNTNVNEAKPGAAPAGNAAPEGATSAASTEGTAPTAAETATSQDLHAEAAAARSEAEQALAEAKRIKEEAEAIRAKAEAEQALAEAKRMKEEAEAIRAKAQAELEKAKGAKPDGEGAKQ